MYWELWDTRSKNLVETFDTEDEALQGVRELLAVNRPDLVDDLSLGAMHDEGETPEAELPPALSGAVLQSRLDEMAVHPEIDDTRRAVHEKIRRWLAEEGWRVRDVPTSLFSLCVAATLESGQTVYILQHRHHIDRITVAQEWKFSESSRGAFSRMSDSSRRVVIHDIYRNVLTSGLNMSQLDDPLTKMRFWIPIYFDALSKDALIQRMLLIDRMSQLTMRTLRLAYAEAGQSTEATESIVHLVPSTGRQQPAAG